TGTQHRGWTRWRLAHAGWGSEDHAERRDELIHARRNAGADVEDARVCPGKRREYGLDDVRDIHEVTLVAAIAEQGDRLAPFPAAEEDGDHALVEVLLRHRFDDLGLRSAMHDRIDPSAAELALKRREVGDIGDAQFGARIEIRAISRREIVHHHDVVAGLEERIDHMAAEE